MKLKNCLSNRKLPNLCDEYHNDVMRAILNMPIWDIFLQNYIDQSKYYVKTWMPNLQNKSKLDPHEVIRQIFATTKEDEYFFLSFMSCGRNYFSPPDNEQTAYEIMQKMEGRRTRIYYSLKKLDQKHKTSEEWIALKRMNKDERKLMSPRLQDYQKFLRLSGQPVIAKSGSKGNPFTLLHNHNILTHEDFLFTT